MLKLVLKASMLIGLVLLSWQVAVWAGQTGSSGGSCQQQEDGGCSASPGGNFVQADFSAHARQSKQTWIGSHPWNWNSCGIDYACGYYTATADLRDPSTAVLPIGCTYHATAGSRGGPVVSCAAEHNLTIEGYNFGLHDCIPLEIAAGQTGTLTIRDNKFAQGANCRGNDTGGGQPILIRAYDGSMADFDFESNYIDGDMYNQDDTITSCLTIATYGNITIKYNAILRCDARPITFPASPIPKNISIVSQYNYIEDFSYRANGAHGEYFMNSFSGGGPVAVEKSSYDTILQGGKSQRNFSTSLDSLTPGNACCVIITAQIDHLVGISNTNAGTNTISYIAWFGGGYGQIIVKDSYVDATGTQNGGADFWGIQSGSCASPASFSGNVNLVTGAGENAWTLNAATGC